MTIILSAVAIAGITLVNSRFDGSFVVGLLLIVVPVLLLAFVLPHLLPVRCSQCGRGMRFSSRRVRDIDLYAYVCPGCSHRYEWEGSSSPASLDC